jgi:hypothetical protein
MSDTVTSGWTGSAKSTATFSEVLVAFTGISGGDSYVVQGALNGSNPKTLTGINLGDYSTTASVTADGVYSFAPCGQVSYTKTGSVSTPTVDLLLKS